MQRKITHPLQIRGDVQAGEEQAQVAGHGLLLGHQRECAIFHVGAQIVDGRVVGDDALRTVEIGVEQRAGGAGHRHVDAAGHVTQRRADRVEFVVIDVAHAVDLRHTASRGHESFSG